MTSMDELMKQKIDLEMKIADIQKEEFDQVVFEINHEIKRYGIVASDLKFPDSPKKERKVNKVAPKYRNDETGETWTGRGRAPLWIKDATHRDHYLIQA